MSKSFFDLGIPEHLPIRDVVCYIKKARAILPRPLYKTKSLLLLH